MEAQLTQIKFIDKGINHLDRIVLIDPVVEIVRKQRALPTICSLGEAPPPTLRSN
jgi:hypothetical protein